MSYTSSYQIYMYMYIRYLLLLLKKCKENTFDVHPTFVYTYLYKQMTQDMKHFCYDKEFIRNYTTLYKKELIDLKKEQMCYLLWFSLDFFIKNACKEYTAVPLTKNLINAIRLHLNDKNMFSSHGMIFPNNVDFSRSIKNIDSLNFDEVISLLNSHHALFEMSYKTNSVDTTYAPYLNIDTIVKQLLNNNNIMNVITLDNQVINFITMLYLLWVPKHLNIASLDIMYDMYIKQCSSLYKDAIQEWRTVSGLDYEALLFIETNECSCENLDYLKSIQCNHTCIRSDSLNEKILVIKHFIKHCQHL